MSIQSEKYPITYDDQGEAVLAWIDVPDRGERRDFVTWLDGPFNYIRRYANCAELFMVDGHNLPTVKVVGRVFKEHLNDPFFWDQPLDDTWAEELIEMAHKVQGRVVLS